MATNTYISIIILNLNGLNAAIQKHRVSDWIKKKSLQYAAYKKHTLGLRTHIDWKWEHGNIYLMQTKMTRKQG